jgi:hypothetical protein
LLVVWRWLLLLLLLLLLWDDLIEMGAQAIGLASRALGELLAILVLLIKLLLLLLLLLWRKRRML